MPLSLFSVGKRVLPFLVAIAVLPLSLAAQERPEEHGDLVVRVAGYSARFTSLSRATQDEIIWRHKYRA